MVEQCVAEFITAGGGTGTPFDILPMARAVLTPAPAGGAADAGAAGCRAACVRAAGAADGCQYFEYRSREAPGMRCWLRALGVGAPASLRSEDATPKVLFMVRRGRSRGRRLWGRGRGAHALGRVARLLFLLPTSTHIQEAAASRLVSEKTVGGPFLRPSRSRRPRRSSQGRTSPTLATPLTGPPSARRPATRPQATRRCLRRSPRATPPTTVWASSMAPAAARRAGGCSPAS
jgi:hypothetical protein